MSRVVEADKPSVRRPEAERGTYTLFSCPRRLWLDFPKMPLHPRPVVSADVADPGGITHSRRGGQTTCSHGTS